MKWYSIMPRLHMSAWTPYSLLNTSGAMYTGVPALQAHAEVFQHYYLYMDGCLSRTFYILWYAMWIGL